MGFGELDWERARAKERGKVWVIEKYSLFCGCWLASFLSFSQMGGSSWGCQNRTYSFPTLV